MVMLKLSQTVNIFFSPPNDLIEVIEKVVYLLLQSFGIPLIVQTERS